MAVTLRSLPGIALAEMTTVSPFVELDLRVVVERHAGERGERLTLAAGREDEHLLGPVVVDLREFDHRPLRHVEVPEVAGDVGVLDHRAAGESELAAVQMSDGYRLLDAMDVRREARDDHAALGFGEDLVKRLSDGTLRGRRARSFGVGRVAEQRQHSALTKACERVHVGDPAVDRRVVEPVVARQHHGAEVCPQHDGQRIRHAVARGDERDGEGTDVQT